MAFFIFPSVLFTHILHFADIIDSMHSPCQKIFILKTIQRFSKSSVGNINGLFKVFSLIA